MNQAVAEKPTTKIAQRAETPLQAVPAPEGVSPMVQLFASGQMDVNQIERMIDLQERYEGNEARKAYHAAMAKARAEMGTAEKSAENSHLNSKYATLDDLIRGASPALSANGFSFSWDVKQEADSVTATCRIIHAMGHEESTPVTMPVTKGNNAVNGAQSVGIAITYAKRYSFSALVGIATEDQDGGPPPPPTVDMIDYNDMTNLNAVCEEVGRDFDKWVAWICKNKGYSLVGGMLQMPKSDLGKAIAQLRKPAK